MGRRQNKYARPFRPLSYSESNTSATKSDGRWVVRTIRPERAVKTYTCPECLRPISPGIAHIVAWPHTPPLGARSGVEYRRHFHTSCWQRRS